VKGISAAELLSILVIGDLSIKEITIAATNKVAKM
jgi:hypothetical protein